MKTAGQILKETRIKKNLDLEQIAQETKIRPLYLAALEDDEYHKLPSPATARGFLKNYAEYLDLSSENILAIFRRDFNEKKTDEELAAKQILVDRKRFNWSPKMTTLAVLALLISLFIFYLIWQYRSLISAPYY